MGMRACLDPDGGPTGLVDKIIGNAYDVVQLVACNLKMIKYVAFNMEAIIAAAQVLGDQSVLVTGVAGGLGTTTPLSLPSTVTPANITASSVILVTTNGTVYSEDSGVFTANIVAGSLKLTLSSSGPGTVAGAAIRWRINFSN